MVSANRWADGVVRGSRAAMLRHSDVIAMLVRKRHFTYGAKIRSASSNLIGEHVAFVFAGGLPIRQVVVQ